MQQIRITKTNAMTEVLDLLKAKYQLMSEADIFKMALSQFYYQEAKEASPDLDSILTAFAQNPRSQSVRSKSDRDYKKWWNKQIKPQLS